MKNAKAFAAIAIAVVATSFGTWAVSNDDQETVVQADSSWGT